MQSLHLLSTPPTPFTPQTSQTAVVLSTGHVPVPTACLQLLAYSFLLNPKPHSHHVGPGHFISRLLYRSPPPIPDFSKHQTQVHSQAQMGTHRDIHADSRVRPHAHTDLHGYTHTWSPEHTWMDDMHTGGNLTLIKEEFLESRPFLLH